jgi:hypothetical protein
MKILINHPIRMQESGYGCGLYAVENVFQYGNFVTDERLSKSKNGINNGQLSQYLQEDGHSMYIDVLYYSCLGGILPEPITELIPEKESEKLPILIQVLTDSKTTKNHLIGGILHNDKTLIVFDSLRPNAFKTTLSGLNDIYHEVFGVFDFVRLGTGDRLAFIN